MLTRFFIRRIFASIIDWLILGIFFAFIGLGIQTIFGVNVIAPGLLKVTSCENQDVVLKARMDQLLPVEDGQVQYQTVCTITHMMVSTHRIAILGRATQIDGVNHKQSISYMVDENNQQINFFSVEVLLYLFGPLLLALWASRFGSTIGKKWLNLFIVDDTGQNPTLKQALKREYLKGCVFAVSAVYSVYEIFELQNISVEELAKMMPPLTEPFGNIQILSIVASGLFAIVVFWFYFGSFIKWRGQAYWDRFAKLKVVNRDDRFRLRNNI